MTELRFLGDGGDEVSFEVQSERRVEVIYRAVTTAARTLSALNGGRSGLRLGLPRRLFLPYLWMAHHDADGLCADRETSSFMNVEIFLVP